MPIVNIQGVGRVNFPDTMSNEDIQSAIEKEILPQFPELMAQVPRGFVGGAKDVGASFISGIGKLAQLPGQVGELMGVSSPERSDVGIQGIGQDIEKFGEEAKSPTLKAKEALRARKINEAEGFFSEAGAALKETATDPALLTSFFAEQIPNLFGSLGIGALAKGGAKVLLRNATEEAIAKVGVRGAVAGNAIMQGTDVGYDTYKAIYEDLIKQGVPEDEAQGIALTKGRIAALEAAGLSVAATKLPGGTTIEKSILGRKLPGTAGFTKSMLGEIGSESIEEGGGAFAKNVNIQDVFPETDVLKGVGAAAALGGLGGGIFGGPAALSLGAQQRRDAELKRIQEEAAKPKPEPVPEGIPGTREVYASEEDRARVEAFRANEARQQSKAFAKLEELQREAEAKRAEQDALKAAGSPFATAEFDAEGNIRPPKAKEPTFGGFLPYDATAGKTPYFVFPDGSVATSREAAFIQKYAPQLGVEGVNELLGRFAPMPEIPQVSSNAITRFGFIPEGGNSVQITEGELVKRKDGSEWLKFYNPEGKPEFRKMDKVLVDPTEEEVIQLEYDNAMRTIDTGTNEFANFLTKQGVKSDQMVDVIGDSKKSKNKIISTGRDRRKLFRADGVPLDELATRARDAGFMTQADIDADGDVGGVRKLTNMINDAYNGDIVVTPKMQDAFAQINQLEEAFRQRRAQIKPEPVPTEADLAPLEGAEREAMIAEQAATLPEEQFVPEGAPISQEISAEQAPIELAYKQAIESKEITEPKAEVRQPQDYYTDKFLADADKLAKDLRKALDSMGLKNVGLNLEDSIYQLIDGKMTEVNGNYFDKLIQLSLSGDNMLRTLNHEALHAMRELGFFSDADWKMLSDMARKEWLAKYDIESKYPNLSEEERIEEAIAYAFADRQTQPQPVKNIVSKMLDMLKRIGNVLRGKGFRTVDSIFEKAAEGKLKEGTPTTESKVKAEIPTPKKLKANLSDVNPDYAQKIIAQFTQAPVTIKDKFKELRPNMAERLIQGLFDEFRSIKKYSEEAYMKSVLSKSTDGALEGLLYYGQVELDNGALNIKKGTKGLLEILEPLGTEVDQYQIWKALSRDAMLPSDKRSFQDLIAQRDELVKGEINGVPRKQVYEKALKEENELNKSVLDIAKQQGIIDDEAYDRFSNDIYYIPFYSEMEDGQVGSVNASSKLTNQYFSKKLKGGKKKTNDLMENVLMNWSHILSASMKNAAADSTLKAAESLDAAQRVKQTTVKGATQYYVVEDGERMFVDKKDVVTIMEKGKEVSYLVTDPMLLDSISLISYLGPKSPFLDVAKGFTNALRYGVTLSPAYKVRNLFRDSVQSAATSRLGMNIMGNVAEGLKLSDRGNPTFISALIGGGIFEMGVAHEGDQAKMIKRLVDKGVKQGTILDNPEKIKAALQRALEWYNEQGNRFENANRLALYQKLINEGKTHLEASFAARDLMNFSSQGSFRAIKLLSQIVPFFNARLQGLYKLGRDGITPTYRLIYNTATGKPIEASDKIKAQSFMAVSSAVMLASTLLYMAFKDDEDFQRREDWDRDNFWWFKIGDVAYRIPKPFEIGALGTIAERTMEQVMDENVEGKVFANRLHAMLSDTFSLNPMPQVFKPMVDIYANKDSFTGAPIESAGLERLSKQERFTDSTSALAKALGGISEAASKVLSFSSDAEGLSPVQVDYAIKAYLGWLGGTAASVSDKAVQPWSDVEKPSKPLIDTIALGFIKTVPETQSKFATAFYENNKRINQAFADMKRYAELGEVDKVAKIMEEKGDLIALQKSYDKVAKQVAQYRKYIQQIQSDKSMNSEEKRLEIERMKILISEATRVAEDMRKESKR